MNKSKIKAVLFYFIFLPVSVSANEQIDWLVWDLSPEYIKEGEYQNQ